MSECPSCSEPMGEKEACPHCGFCRVCCLCENKEETEEE